MKPANKEILLTMGMPVYDEEKHIGEAIESLLAQTYKDFILIISDNASTDRTSQICREYAEKDSRIIYVRQAENKGGLFNFRYVLEQANTPYFMWCGGHDKWDPFFVEKLIPAVGKDNIILSYCTTGSIGLDGKMGKISERDCDTSAIDNPAKRYAYVLTHSRWQSGLFHGIWLTQALKNCNFNFKTYAPDNIILDQASLEGKFKQNKEVLFWLRTVRDEETHSQMLKRQSAVNDKKFAMNTNINVLKIAYLFESTKIIFIKKYSLPMVVKIWLTIDMICFKSMLLYIRPAAVSIAKKILPGKVYFKLKIAWRKRNNLKTKVLKNG
ncbi:MAG: glycosyltransferase family A protein [Candidatus Staskawiczbacteria bacterium]|jgi:glycosyltransferase involved in cell wall biosynthesis